MVYSFAGTRVVAGPEFTHVLTEAAKVSCLMNSADLEASIEMVLRLGVARSQMPKQKAAARPTAARPQAQLEKAKKPRCRVPRRGQACWWLYNGPKVVENASKRMWVPAITARRKMTVDVYRWRSTQYSF